MAKTTVLALVLFCVVCALGVEIRVTPTSAEQELLTPLGSPLLSIPTHHCSRDGIFPIPDDCTAYIICRRGRERRRQCPDGFRFDSVKLCTPDDTADCGITSLKQSLENKLCPRSYGVFPYPDDCRKYVVCHEGRGRVKKCYEGSIYVWTIGCVESDVCPVPYPSETEKPEDDNRVHENEESEADDLDDILKTLDEMIHTVDTMRQIVDEQNTNFNRKYPDRSVCDLPRERGQCYGNIRRYYYESKSCNSFVYGGCRETSDESVCELPHRIGSCHGYFPRYYYDSESRTCQQFIYGGCRGNANNFKTLDECKDSCARETETEEHEYKEFQCRKNGRFANPNSCDSYIECSVSRGHVDMELIQCPSNQHYNIETEQCDDKCNAQCDQDLACTCQWPHCLITCERPNGLFPVPTNCRLYLQCRNRIPKIIRCPEGKAFDPELRECVNIEETNCVTKVNDIWGIMPS